MSCPRVAGVAIRIGVADSDGSQQHTARHPAAPGIDVQEANASPLISDAPTNAARAIVKIRSLLKAIGMVLFRKGRLCAFDTPAQSIVGAPNFEDKLNVPFASDGAGGPCRATYLYV